MTASERHARWRMAHLLRWKEIQRRSYLKHRATTNAKQRAENKTSERKAYMRAYLRKHRADHPELYAAYVENRRARKLGNEGSFTFTEWIEKCESFGWACVYCCRVVPLTIDHLTPLSRGGTNYISNIAPACKSCNSSKHDLTVYELFLREFA